MFSTDEDDLFYITAKSYAAGLSIPERKLHNIADFCRYAFIGFFLQFIWEHMEADVDQIVDDLDTYLRCFMVSALSVESSRSLQKN